MRNALHSVSKSKKKSHSILRAKRATLYLSGQKFIKNAKIGPFGRVCKSLMFVVKQSYQTGQKLAEDAKIEKFKCDIFSDFQSVWL